MKGKNMRNKMTVRQKFALALLVIGGPVVLSAIFAACKNDTEPTPDPKPTLTGTVDINGTMEVGKTVTAGITGSNGTTGMFTYKWTRTPGGGQAMEITGANEETYTITAADLDHVLGAIIGNEDTNGTITGTGASKVGPDPATLPKDQSATISNLFGGSYSTTVKGHMTNSEWSGVAGKIEAALNSAYADAVGPTKGRFTGVFNDPTVIIVEKTTEYAKYKVIDGEFKNLYPNIDALNNGLQASITAAVIAMHTDTPDMAKAIQPNGHARVSGNGHS